METRPNKWIAGILGLFLPSLGMLYARRPWLALLLFGLQIVVSVVVSTPLVVNLSGAWAVPTSIVFNFLGAMLAFDRAANTEPTERRWFSKWHALLSIGAGYFLCVFFVRAFIYEPFRVPSPSMYPTIPEGSLIIVDKSGYGHYSAYGIRIFETTADPLIRRGDIVVHQTPANPGTSYVRTVVGLPGDNVVYTGNRLTLNGQAIATTVNRVDAATTYATELIDGRRVSVVWVANRYATDFSIVVPPDHYLLFGDNRNNAMDSRFIGAIPTNLIVGKVVKVFRPRE